MADLLDPGNLARQRPGPLAALRALALVLGLLAGGCVTPVIPLPPPSPDSLTYSEGLVTVHGRNAAHGGSLVYVFHPASGTGVITMADEETGAWTSDPILAEQGDELHLWASRWSEDSPSAVVCILVAPDAQRGYRECSR